MSDTALSAISKKWIFFGAGTMARLLSTRLQEQHSLDFFIYTPTGIRAKALASELKGSALGGDWQGTPNGAVWVICCKPQQYPALLSSLLMLKEKGVAPSVVISVMAGISTSTLTQTLGFNVPVVRLMPNTNLKLGLGANLLYFNEKTSSAIKMAIEQYSVCWGKSFILEQEEEIEELTPLSGSGPAYFYHFLHVLNSYYTGKGYSPIMIQEILAKLLEGAWKRMENETTLIDFEKWRDEVVSKAGITAKALETLADYHFEEMWNKSQEAAYARAKELAAVRP